MLLWVHEWNWKKSHENWEEICWPKDLLKQAMHGPPLVAVEEGSKEWVQAEAQKVSPRTAAQTVLWFSLTDLQAEAASPRAAHCETAAKNRLHEQKLLPSCRQWWQTCVARPL